MAHIRSLKNYLSAGLANLFVTGLQLMLSCQRGLKSTTDDIIEVSFLITKSTHNLVFKVFKTDRHRKSFISFSVKNGCILVLSGLCAEINIVLKMQLCCRKSGSSTVKQDALL